MGRGGYIGGSTVIGPGRRSSDLDWEFRDGEKFGARIKHKPLAPALPRPTIAGVVVGRKVLKKHRLALAQAISRDAVLIGLERGLPKKPADRRLALKQLVADGILLPTGAINIGHPAVGSWLKLNRKTIKHHG